MANLHGLPGTPVRNSEGDGVNSGVRKLSLDGRAAPAATPIRGDGVGAAGH